MRRGRSQRRHIWTFVQLEHQNRLRAAPWSSCSPILPRFRRSHVSRSISLSYSIISAEYLKLLHKIVHFLSNRLSRDSKGTIDVKKSNNFLRHFLVSIFDVTEKRNIFNWRKATCLKAGWQLDDFARGIFTVYSAWRTKKFMLCENTGANCGFFPISWEASKLIWQSWKLVRSKAGQGGTWLTPTHSHSRRIEARHFCSSTFHKRKKTKC